MIQAKILDKYFFYGFLLPFHPLLFMASPFFVVYFFNYIFTSIFSPIFFFVFFLFFFLSFHFLTYS